MRWYAAVILAYVLLGAQLGMGGHWGFDSFGANLPMVAVIFICLNAPREPALTFCLVLGLIQDLLTGDRPGIHAFAYGLVGLFTTSAARVVFRDHPVTHIVCTFVGQILLSATVLAASLVHHTHPPAASLLGASLYTAALAPLVIFFLERIKPFFGFTSPDRRVRSY